MTMERFKQQCSLPGPVLSASHTKVDPFRPGGASWYFLMGEADRNRIKNSGGLR